MPKQSKADRVQEAITKLETQIESEHNKAVQGQLRCEGGMLALQQLKELLSKDDGDRHPPA